VVHFPRCARVQSAPKISIPSRGRHTKGPYRDPPGKGVEPYLKPMGRNSERKHKTPEILATQHRKFKAGKEQPYEDREIQDRKKVSPFQGRKCKD